jgi:DNA-binding beta-propeller fold protein YncE
MVTAVRILSASVPYLVLLPLLLQAGCGSDAAGPGYTNPQVPDSLLCQVSLGSCPQFPCQAPGTDLFFITNRMSQDITVVLGTDSFLPVDTILVGGEPRHIAASADGGSIYVTRYSSEYMLVLDTSGGAVTDSIAVGSAACGLEMSPGGEYLFIPSTAQNTVTKVRTSDNTVVSVLETEWAPLFSEILPGGDFMYLGNDYLSTIAEVRTSDNTLARTLEVPGNPWLLLASADGSRLFAFDRDYDDPRFHVIRLSDGVVENTVRTTRRYHHGYRIPGTSTAILSRYWSDRVSVLNMDNLVFAPSIETGDEPAGVLVSEDGEYLLVVNSMSDDMYVFGMR